MLEFLDIINYLNSCLYGSFDFLMTENQIISYSVGPIKNRFGVDLLLEWQIQWKKLHYHKSLDLVYTFYGVNFFQKIPYSVKTLSDIKFLIQNPIFLKRNFFNEGFRLEDSLYVIDYINLNGSQKRSFFEMLDKFFGNRSVYKYGVFQTDLSWIKQSLYLNNKVYPVSPMTDYFTNLWVYLRPDNVNVMKMSDAGFKEIGYFARDHVLRYLHHVFDLHQLSPSDLGRKDVRYFLQKESFRLDDYIFHMGEFSVLGDMSKRFRILEQEFLKWIVYQMPPLEFSFRSLEHFGYIPGMFTKVDGGTKFQLANSILVENFPKDVSYNILAQKGMLYRFFNFFMPEYVKSLEVLNNVASYYEIQESKGFTLGLNRYYRSLGKAVASTINIPLINEDTSVWPVLRDLKKALLLDVYDLEANNYYNHYKQHVRIWVDYETIYEKYKEEILEKYIKNIYPSTVDNVFENKNYSFALSKVYDDKNFYFSYLRMPTGFILDEYVLGEYSLDKEIKWETFVNGYMNLRQNGFPAFLTREAIEPYYHVDILENGGMYFLGKLENEYIYYTEQNYSESLSVSPFNYSNTLGIDNEVIYHQMISFFRESLPFTIKSYFSDVEIYGDGYEVLYFDEIFKLEGQVYVRKWKQNEQLLFDLSSVFEYCPDQKPFILMPPPIPRDVGFEIQFYNDDLEMHRLTSGMFLDDPLFFIRQDISTLKGAFLHFVEKEYENSYEILSISNFSLHVNDLVYIVFQMADLEFLGFNPSFLKDHDFMSEKMDVEELPDVYEPSDWDSWEKDLVMEKEIDFLDSEETLVEKARSSIENSLDYALESDLNESLDYFQVSQQSSLKMTSVMEQDSIFESLNLTDDFVKEYLLQQMDIEEWIDLMMTVFEFEEPWMFDYLKMSENEKLRIFDDVELSEETFLNEDLLSDEAITSSEDVLSDEEGIGYIEFSDSYVSDTEINEDFLEIQSVSDNQNSDEELDEWLDTTIALSSSTHFHFDEPPKTPSDVDSDEFRFVEIDDVEQDLVYGIEKNKEFVEYQSDEESVESMESTESIDYVNVLDDTDKTLDPLNISITEYHEYDMDDFWILYQEDLWNEDLLDLDIDILQIEFTGFELDPSSRDLAHRQVSFYVYNELKVLKDFLISVEEETVEDLILSVFAQTLDLHGVFQDMILDNSDLNILPEHIFEGLAIWFGEDMKNLFLNSSEFIVEEYIPFSEDIKDRENLDLFLETLDPYFFEFFGIPIMNEFMSSDPIFEGNVLSKHFFDSLDDYILRSLDENFFNDFLGHALRIEDLEVDSILELSVYAKTFEEWMLFYNDFEVVLKLDMSASLFEISTRVENEKEEKISFFEKDVISNESEEIKEGAFLFKEELDVLDSEFSDEEIFSFGQTFGYMSLFIEDFYGDLTTNNIFRLYVQEYSDNLELGIFMDLFTDDFRLILEDEGHLTKEFVDIGLEVFLKREEKSSLALTAIYQQLIFLDNLIYYERILNSKLSDYFVSLYSFEYKQGFLVLKDVSLRTVLFDVLEKSEFNKFNLEKLFQPRGLSLTNFYKNYELEENFENEYVSEFPLVVEQSDIELFKDVVLFNSTVFISVEGLEEIPSADYQTLVREGGSSRTTVYFLKNMSVSFSRLLNEIRWKIFLRENRNLDNLSDFGVTFIKYFLEYFHSYDFLKNNLVSNFYFFGIEMIVLDRVFLFLNVENEIFFNMKDRFRPLLHVREFLQENIVFEGKSYYYDFPSIDSIVSQDRKSLSSYAQMIHELVRDSVDLNNVSLELRIMKQAILEQIVILDREKLELFTEVREEEAERISLLEMEDPREDFIMEEILTLKPTSVEFSTMETNSIEVVNNDIKISEVRLPREALETEPLTEEEESKMTMTLEEMREKSNHKNLGKSEIIEGEWIDINDNNINNNTNDDDIYEASKIQGFSRIKRTLEEIDSFTDEQEDLERAIALSLEEEHMKKAYSSGKEEVIEEKDFSVKVTSQDNKEIMDQEVINLSLKTHEEEEKRRMMEDEDLAKAMAESKLTAFEDDKRRALVGEPFIRLRTDMEGTLEMDREIRERDKRQLERELYEGQMVASALSLSIREYEDMTLRQRGEEAEEYFLSVELIKRSREMETIIGRYLDKKGIFIETSLVSEDSVSGGYLVVSTPLKVDSFRISINVNLNNYLNNFFYNQTLIELLEEYRFKNKNNDYIAFAVGEIFLQEYLILWNKYLQNLMIRPNILLAEKRAYLFLEEIFFRRYLYVDLENENLEEGLEENMDFFAFSELEESALSYMQKKDEFREVIYNSFLIYKSYWYQRYIIEGPVWWDSVFEVTDYNMGFDRVLFEKELVSAQQQLLQSRTTRFMGRQVTRPLGNRNIYIGNSLFFNMSPIPIEKWIHDHFLINHIFDQTNDLVGFRPVSYEQKLFIKRKILSLLNIKFRMSSDFIHYSLEDLMNLLIKRLNLSKSSLFERDFPENLLMNWYFNIFVREGSVTSESFIRFVDEVINVNSQMGYEEIIRFYADSLEKISGNFEAYKKSLGNDFSSKDFEILNALVQKTLLEEDEYFGVMEPFSYEEFVDQEEESINIIEEKNSQEEEETILEEEDKISLEEAEKIFQQESQEILKEESPIMDNRSNKVINRGKLLKAVRFDPVSGSMKVSEVAPFQEVLETESSKADEKDIFLEKEKDLFEEEEIKKEEEDDLD